MIEVKVGDFVECLDGEIGYVTNVECVKENEVKFEIKLLNYENNVLVNCNNWFVKTYFKRIGSHDFTIKENKIEPLNIIPKYEYIKCKVATINSTDYPNTPITFNTKIEKVYCGIEEIKTIDLYNKINEIIAYINKEDKE